MARPIAKRLKIYTSRWHLLATFAVILLPFLFLMIFSAISRIDISTMYDDLGVSFIRLLIAYIIAVILAWIFGVLFFRGKAAAVALPIFDVLQSFPTFAALPAAVYLWGVSNLTVIVFLVITIIWPILFSVISALKLIRQDWDEVFEIYQVKRFSYIKNFIFPVTIPGLITGSIIGLGEGWEALIATEIIVGIKTGLGPFFQMFSTNVAVTAFGILGFLILIFSINKLIWLPLLDWSHERMED